MKKNESTEKYRGKDRLFGIPKDQLGLVRGGGGVIIEKPREGAAIIE